MKFEEAMAAARAGSKIRCPAIFMEGWYWEYVGESLCRGDGRIVDFSLPFGDYFEAEWEIVSEPKRFWRRPVKYKSGEWALSLDFHPSKEKFMDGWGVSAVGFGPWESIEEPELVHTIESE